MWFRVVAILREGRPRAQVAALQSLPNGRDELNQCIIRRTIETQQAYAFVVPTFSIRPQNGSCAGSNYAPLPTPIAMGRP
jgi:hypothetical protein